MFEAGWCANAEASGVAGVGVTDWEWWVAMDSISAVPDRDLLKAAKWDEEGASDPVVDTREAGRLFDEFEERDFEKGPWVSLDADNVRITELCRDERVNKSW
jgi:hypothetical protein